MNDGFLVIDKPGGITSHDVVGKLRRIFETKRVGHAGTLDPLATGVLVIGINSATRFLQFIKDGKKRYLGTIRLGSSTTTDDSEGEIIASATVDKLIDLSDIDITNNLKKMIGEISQRPSSVSAIKIAGKRAYQRVRDGEEFELPARNINIYEINIKRIERGERYIDVEVEISCSAGTYIRAIARDLGEALGVGGHLISLRRTEVSPFLIDDAVQLEQVSSESVIPLAELARKIFPVREIDLTERSELSFGRPLSPSNFSGIGVAMFNGSVCALIENRPAGAQPIAVFLN